MADYFPLLERAVAGLRDSTVESRGAIYDRARAALVGQLRSMDPPVPEPDIERETAALDDAIRRLEDRLAAPPIPPPSVADQPSARLDATAAPRRPLPPGSPTAKAPAVAPPPTRERPAAPSPQRERPAAPPARPLAPARERPSFAPMNARPSSVNASPPPAPRPASAEAASPAASPLRSEPNPPRRTSTGAPKIGVLNRSEEPAVPVPVIAPVLPTAPSLQVQSFAATLDSVEAEAEASAPASAAEDAYPVVEASESDPRRREDLGRPYASRPPSKEPRGAGFWIFSTLALLLMIGIGIVAWTVRDQPQDIAGPRAAAPNAIESPGKISGRADGSGAADQADSSDTNNGTATVPAPIPQSQTEGSSASGPAPTAPQNPADAIAVSQRAALLVEAPDDPQKVKTFVGTVLWGNESVSPGQGQPLATAVKADVDIPEAKMKMTMIIQKNTEPQFPASHTVEFKFTLLPGNTLGGIKQINVPEMRKDDEAQTGTPMAGVPVSITDNYFLVGLSRGAAEGPNLKLMEERNWFDLTILLTSGKVAKVTFEKGATGQRAMENAFKAWQ